MVIARSMRYPTERKGSGLASAVNQIKDIPGVSRVILFGACARAPGTEDGDIDIAVFFDTENGLHEEYRRLARLCQQTELDIQIAIFINTEKNCLLDEYQKLVNICRQTNLDLRVQVFHDYDLSDPRALMEDIVTYGIDLPLSSN